MFQTYLNAGKDTPSTSKKQNDLYEEMKPLLYFGRVALVIPHGKSDHPLFQGHQFGVNTIFQLLQVLLACWTLVTVFFAGRGLVLRGSGDKIGVMGYVSNSQILLTSLMEAFILIYFFIKSRKFYNIFERWLNLSQQFHLPNDVWLRPLALVLILCPLVRVSLTCMYHYDIIQNVRQKNAAYNDKLNNANETSDPSVVSTQKLVDTSITRMFYDTSMQSWMDYIPYNQGFVIVFFLLKLLKSISWYYVPTLLVFFSRAMYFQYRKLILDATGGTVSEAHFVDFTDKDKKFWSHLVKKHQSLSLLVKTINSFLSPIIFAWVSMYVYITALELFSSLFEGLTSDASASVSVAIFAVELFQFMIPLIIAAKVNTYATKILNVLRNCPREHYHDTDVCRLEHHISIGPNIAFTGLGVFSISRQFLLKVFNGVFTMEIVLLQSAESAKTTGKTK